MVDHPQEGGVRRHARRWLLATTCAAGALALPASAQADYAITQSTGPLVRGTTDIGIHCDDCVMPIALPFPVRVYGQRFSSANVSSNGNVQFGGTPSPVYSNACLPDGSLGLMVAAYYDDLLTFGGGVFTATLGSAPNRDFVIEWIGNQYSSGAFVDAELIFHEGSETITAGYGPLGEGGVSATTGVQRGPFGPGTQFSCNSQVLASGLRLDYSYSPTPTSPTNLTGRAPNGKSVRLDWQAPSDPRGLAGYNVYRDGRLLASLGTVVTYTDPTVAFLTDYAYTVRARAADGSLSDASNEAALMVPFSDSFKTGTLGKWTSSGNVTVQRPFHFNDRFGARATLTGNAAPTFMLRQFGTPQTSVFGRALVQYLASGRNQAPGLALRNSGGTTIVTVFRTKDGFLAVRYGPTSTVLKSTIPLQTAHWYELQLHAVVNGAASNTEVFLDGVKIEALSQPLNLGSDPVTQLVLGDPSPPAGFTWDVVYDKATAQSSFIAF
jgi:hypothetical protein